MILPFKLTQIKNQREYAVEEFMHILFLMKTQLTENFPLK